MSYWKTQSCYTCEYRVGTRCRLNPPGGETRNKYSWVGDKDEHLVEEPSQEYDGIFYAPACAQYKVNEVQFCEGVETLCREIDEFSAELSKVSQ